MTIKRNINLFCLIIASILLVFMPVSCNKSEPEIPISVTTKKSNLNSSDGQTFITVNTDIDWELTLQFEAEPWATLSLTQGSGQTAVILSYQENKNDKARSLVITGVNSTGLSDVLVIKQDGLKEQHSDNNDEHFSGEIKEDPVCKWLELPATDSNDGLLFFTHRMKHYDRDIRDWSFYYDTKNLVSHWVAYPLNKSLIGRGDRTNDWGHLDYHLPRDLQPVLNHGFRSDRKPYYDRGHQCPSADRLNPESNRRTFLGTNMTPQVGNLNQHVWAKLESKVRSWAYKFDTLYVVTGCKVDQPIGYAYDNDRKKVAVPEGYYKALLGYSRNKTTGSLVNRTGGYTAIAFYFDHQYYYSGQHSQEPLEEENIMTVRELEQKLGIDFFVNLEEKIGTDRYNTVETERDSYWTKTN